MSELHPPPINVPLRRGDVTRERLLDAAEGWVAEAGFDAPTHRGIGERAHVHTALVNYHFGSKEVLLEDMVERRAPRLIDVWREALGRVREAGGFGADAVLAAYWEPFRSLNDEQQPWRRYLCVVAHLFHDRTRAASRARYFGLVERDFHEALRDAVQGLSEDDVRHAFQYARTLLDEALFYRCVENTERAIPAGFHGQDVPSLIRFLAAGIAVLPQARDGSSRPSSFQAAAD